MYTFAICECLSLSSALYSAITMWYSNILYLYFIRQQFKREPKLPESWTQVCTYWWSAGCCTRKYEYIKQSSFFFFFKWPAQNKMNAWLATSCRLASSVLAMYGWLQWKRDCPWLGLPQCPPRGPDIHEGLGPELLVEELHPILRMRVCLGQITKGTHQCS